LKIAVHTGGIQKSTHSGVGAHTLALLQQFKRFRNEFEFHVLNDVPDEVHLPESFHYHPGRLHHPLYRVYQDHLGSGLTASRYNVDLLLCPKSIAPAGFSGKTVITIHDLIFKKYPDSYSLLWRQYWNASLNLSLNRSDRIISVSESTKRDLVKIMDVDEDKVTVIPNGLDFDRFTRNVTSHSILRDRYHVPDRYILYVGQFFPRKNLSRLLEAFAPLSEQYPDYSLVLAGPGGEGEQQVRSLVTSLGMGDRVVFTGYVDDDDLPGLYKHSSGLVYPSVDEGFGMPLLEAFATGTRVACSDRAVFREIDGDLPVFFDPHDGEEIRDALQRIIERYTFDTDRAREVAERYRWSHIGDRYRSFFNDVNQSRFE